MKNINIELESIGKDAVSAAINTLGQHNLSNSRLANNIKYKMKNDLLLLTLPGYAQFTDAGRQPGKQPPIKSIKKWAKAKGLNPYAVAVNIKKYGTKPNHFLYSITDIFKKSGQRIANAGLKDIIPITDNFFKKTGGKIK